MMFFEEKKIYLIMSSPYERLFPIFGEELTHYFRLSKKSSYVDN